MKDQRYVWNPFRMISPKLNAEVGRIDELHTAPVSGTRSPEESLLVMIGKLIEVTKILSACFVGEDRAKLEECDRLAQEVHAEEHTATSGLVGSSSAIGQNAFKIIVRFPSRIERIGMMFENILSCARIKIAHGIPFSDKALGELAAIFSVTIDLLVNLRDSLIIPNKVILKHIRSQVKNLNQLIEDARFAHWERLEAGYCSPAASSIYLGVLDSFKTVNQYVANMTESLGALVAPVVKE
jgi:phosphate:Na+ symporter